MGCENKIHELSKYLISKGVSSPLKLQKLLFFFRYEEILSGKIEQTYFKENNNFEAWIYGPVNYDSYVFCQNYFWGQDEKDKYLLYDTEIKKIDKIYGKYFNKWNQYDSSSLVNKSHKNVSWIEARSGLGDDVPCQNSLDESKEKFVKFIK